MEGIGSVSFLEHISLFFSDFDFISSAKIEDLHGMSYLHFFMRDNQK